MTLIASTPEQKSIATGRLDRYIQEGQVRAVATMERVAREVPADYISPATRMTVSDADGGRLVLNVGTADGRTAVAAPLHRHALGNVASQASMPMAYVDHLLGVVASERVDLVVVAGDIYDRALPHVDAVRLADETLARLAASRARVVLTSGNHDSAQRLGFGSRLRGRLCPSYR